MAFQRALFLLVASALTVVKAADADIAKCNSTTGYDWVCLLTRVIAFFLPATDLFYVHSDGELVGTVPLLCRFTLGRSV